MTTVKLCGCVWARYVFVASDQYGDQMDVIGLGGGSTLVSPAFVSCDGQQSTCQVSAWMVSTGNASVL